MITLSGRVINADGDPQRCTIVAKQLPESLLDLSNNLVYYGDVTQATDEQGYFSLRLKNGPGIAYTLQTKGQHYLPQGLVLDGNLPDGTNVELSDLRRKEGTPLPPTLQPLEGPAGPSAYEEWASLPGNEGKTLEDFYYYLMRFASEEAPSSELQNHIEAAEPHHAYDRDMIDLSVLFDNRLI